MGLIHKILVTIEKTLCCKQPLTRRDHDRFSYGQLFDEDKPSRSPINLGEDGTKQLQSPPVNVKPIQETIRIKNNNHNQDSTQQIRQYSGRNEESTAENSPGVMTYPDLTSRTRDRNARCIMDPATLISLARTIHDADNTRVNDSNPSLRSGRGDEAVGNANTVTKPKSVRLMHSTSIAKEDLPALSPKNLFLPKAEPLRIVDPVTRIPCTSLLTPPPISLMEDSRSFFDRALHRPNLLCFQTQSYLNTVFRGDEACYLSICRALASKTSRIKISAKEL